MKEFFIDANHEGISSNNRARLSEVSHRFKRCFPWFNWSTIESKSLIVYWSSRYEFLMISFIVNAHVDKRMSQIDMIFYRWKTRLEWSYQCWKYHRLNILHRLIEFSSMMEVQLIEEVFPSIKEVACRWIEVFMIEWKTSIGMWPLLLSLSIEGILLDEVIIYVFSFISKCIFEAFNKLKYKWDSSMMKSPLNGVSGDELCTQLLK